jgi:hypothetical protein
VKTLTFVEVDIDTCALAYGVAPCAATLAGPDPTGTRKCFNTKATCQDRANYANTPITLRFAMGAGYLAESGIDAIACITDVSLTAGTISLGEDLGTRSTLKVTFQDFPWPDTGPGHDPYVTERPYDPYLQGTYWGKFRARQPYLRGKPIRIIRGELGQSLAEMDTRHFILESFEGPSLDGRYSLIAKDALKMADADRALAPKLSQGFLVADIDAVVTSAALSPAGIGNLDYPASGWVAIGGKEICAFTRVADVLTLTRAQFGTDAAEHDAQDRVQLCLNYVGEDPADIIADLFTNYAQVPAEYIPLASWQTETGTFLRRVYTRLIAEPTAVNKLVSDMVQQGALAIWWDDRERLIRLQVLRRILTDAAVFDESNTLTKTLRIREQADKRVSQVWTYFGMVNPLKKADDADNYRSSAVTVDPQAEDDYGAPAVKRIYASWIPAFGRQVAFRMNDIQLGRFRSPPRHFNLSSFRLDALVPVLGRGYQLQSRVLQDDTGAADSVPLQIVRLQPGDSGYEIEADEMRFVSFDGGDLDNRVIIIDANALDVNFRAAHDSLYPEPVSGDAVHCIIEAGVIVGSSSVASPAFDVGDWPAGVILTMAVKGRIQGRGGNGGGTLLPTDGGTALYARYAVDVDATGGEIWGGGGGGGFRGQVTPSGTKRWGGSGGQGFQGGNAGVGDQSTGLPGTPEAPGAATNGAGAGGAAGMPGGAGIINSTPLPGGAAGEAIDGVSFLTITGAPDIRGAQIN